MSRLFDDSVPEYLSRGSAVVSNFPLTISAKVNLDTLGAAQTIAAVVDSGGDQNWFRLYVTAANQMAVDSNSAAGYVSVNTTNTLSINTWHQGAFSVGSATARSVYIDGGDKTDETVTTSTPTGLDTTSVGRLQRLTPIQPLSGMIAEVGMWNVALGVGEHAALGKGVSPLFIRPASLIAYWPIIGRTSPEIEVIGGAGLTLTGTSVAAHPMMYYSSNNFSVSRAAAAGFFVRKYYDQFLGAN